MSSGSDSSNTKRIGKLPWFRQVVIGNPDKTSFDGAVVKNHRSGFKRKWAVEALKCFAMKGEERHA